MRNKNKAIFLDRDGVIINDVGYLKNINQIKFLPKTFSALNYAYRNNYQLIIITNQSAINRGLTNNENVEKINQKIQEFLKKNGTSIDAFYYCPHRPDENCTCRKPNPGLIIKAINDFNIDINKSWFVGDQESDFLTAKKIGCGFVQVNNSKNLKDVFKEILEFRH